MSLLKYVRLEDVAYSVNSVSNKNFGLKLSPSFPAIMSSKALILGKSFILKNDSVPGHGLPKMNPFYTKFLNNW